ncbi:MAG: hypothetical protein EA397_14620 [Deltaproteobacteria bacterium]|nr:MAG: hypothetical protein EA397_14620 [Deltaproteobacteria bacterium]
MIPLLSLLSAVAYGNTPDMFGQGAQNMGSGGGGVAMVQDGTAAWLNPAGLGRIRRPSAKLGYVIGFDNFRPVPDLYWDTNRDGSLDGRDPPLPWDVGIERIHGMQISVGRQIGGKFGLGATAWFPAQRLYRLSTIEPDLPHYVMYQNRPQRYSMNIGIGGEVVKGVNLGIAMDLHSRAAFDLYGTLHLTASGAENPDAPGLDGLIQDVVVDVHELTLDLRYAALPIFGVQLELGKWAEELDGLVIGASYRPGMNIAINADLDIQANIEVRDVGDLDPYLLAALVKGRANLFDHTVPGRLNLGVAWRTDDVFSAYLDATWSDWRSGRFNVTQLQSAEITSPLVDLDDAVSDGNAYTVDLRTTWSLRTGMDLKLPPIELDNKLRYMRFAVRGGFAWNPTPLRAQGSNSAFLDSDRITFTLGGGLEVYDPFDLVDGPVRLDLFGQLHRIGNGALPRSTDVPRAGFPVEGTSIPIGGQIVMIGAQWGFDY